mgnify:CR=1 FL=1|tara:strand:- start:108 stop:491 length:384 start_codon:yes stop_codon:yes gene_type:complete
MTQTRKTITEKPFIGMGATHYLWTDSQAYQVAIIDKKKNYDLITLGRCVAERIDDKGMCNDGQEYTYKLRRWGWNRKYLKCYTTEYDNRKHYEYVQVEYNEKTKRWNKCKKQNILLGHQKEFYDYSF